MELETNELIRNNVIAEHIQDYRDDDNDCLIPDFQCRTGEILNEDCECEIDLNDPCANKDLRNKVINPSVLQEMNSRTQIYSIPRSGAVEVQSFTQQTIEGGLGDRINQDRYSTNITKLPEGFTAFTLFEYIRRNFDSFIEGGNIPLVTDVEFEAYSARDQEIWNSENPVGAAMDFKTIADTSTVYTIEYSAEELNWTFATVRSAEHMGHLFSGYRQFGIEPDGNGGYSFYTRGADRLGGDLDVLANAGDSDFLYKLAGDANWKNMIENLEEYIENLGGTVSKTFDKNKTYGFRYPYSSEDCK